uniref:Uncharacterized protein n=1 Tax=Rhizophora mucronata TaxID=61149 RepID=A0A2P2P187_RHIMU
MLVASIEYVLIGWVYISVLEPVWANIRQINLGAQNMDDSIYS